MKILSNPLKFRFLRRMPRIFSISENFHLLKIHKNFFCVDQKRDDVEIDTVISKLETTDQIYEFFNSYYDTMPEGDIAKLVRYFKTKFELLELSETTEMKTFHRNIFEISENIKDVTNLSIVIDFIIDSLPTDTNIFIIALDKLIQNNFEKLLSNNMKIITKYYSNLFTDVNKYYEITWEIICNQLEIHLSKNSFWDVIEIFNHFHLVTKIDDKILSHFSKVINDKFNTLTDFQLGEDSDEIKGVIAIYYSTRCLKQELDNQSKNITKISFSDENKAILSRLIEIASTILSENLDEDLESIYENMKEEDKSRMDDYESEIKGYIERYEISKKMKFDKNL